MKMTALAALQPILAQQAAPGGASNPLVQFLPFILIFAAMYFLMIAPQRKKQKEHQKMLEELTAGDEIVTSGGVYGQIVSKKEDRFVVRVADNVRIEVGKAFVQTVLKKTGEDKK